MLEIVTYCEITKSRTMLCKSHSFICYIFGSMTRYLVYHQCVGESACSCLHDGKSFWSRSQVDRDWEGDDTKTLVKPSHNHNVQIYFANVESGSMYIVCLGLQAVKIDASQL